ATWVQSTRVAVLFTAVFVPTDPECSQSPSLSIDGSQATAPLSAVWQLHAKSVVAGQVKFAAKFVPVLLVVPPLVPVVPSAPPSVALPSVVVPSPLSVVFV
ncbi:MAG: hypothetical protein RL011_2173, partial [Pseudomonadota bacterium]